VSRWPFACSTVKSSKETINRTIIAIDYQKISSTMYIWNIQCPCSVSYVVATVKWSSPFFMDAIKKGNRIHSYSGLDGISTFCSHLGITKAIKNEEIIFGRYWGLSSKQVYLFRQWLHHELVRISQF
jgi:hypothetical protein